MKKKILEILRKIRSDLDYTKETGLLTDEVFDSFDILLLLAEINEKLHIEIKVEDITEENFDSCEAICKYLEKRENMKR